MSEPDNADQIAYWNDKAAATWTEFQERLDALFLPITEAALSAAAPSAGEHVIDVGCGCGATVLEIGRQVGPAGSVVGVDVSQPMLARADQRIRAAALANASVVVSDAASHRFPPATANLLFSRFGVMFFADPIAAFANLRTAMRADGRLLFACWRPMVENSWFSVPLDAARPLLPPQPPADPTAPGPFAFADPDRTQKILASAGWRNIHITRHDAAMQISGPGQIEQATIFATRLGALARLLTEVDDTTRAAVRHEVAAALKPYDGATGVVLGGSVWLVSATAS